MKLLTDKNLLKGQGYIPGIYKVTNIKTGKVYIGQTVHLRKRFSDYNNYHHNLNALHSIRPLYQEILKYGNDNFTYEVLEFCDSVELTSRENYYIKMYDSTNPQKGYNIVRNNMSAQNDLLSRFNKSMGHIGLSQSNDTKRKKSNKIIAVKGNTIIYVDSAKLFGDYIGRSKDQVKNYLRNPTSVHNYFVYYYDHDKRDQIREKVLDKLVLNKKMDTYLKILDSLERLDHESVETRNKFYNIAILSYDNVDEMGIPILKYISKVD